MFIINVLLAVLIAALSGMGVGGGGLLVIWLVLIMDMPSRTAQGINLVFFVISALAALPVHLLRRLVAERGSRRKHRLRVLLRIDRKSVV